MNKQQGFVDFVYNVDKTNMVFAIASVMLVISMFWMVWDDYDRQWKGLQREGMALEEHKTQALILNEQKNIDGEALKQLEDDLSDIEKAIESHRDRYETAQAELKRLTQADFYIVDQGYKFEKAKYDVAKYEYEEAKHQGHTSEANEKKIVLDAMAAKINEFQIAREGVEARMAEQEKIIDAVSGKRDGLEQQKRAMMKTVDNLNRRLSSLVPSFPNLFRNMPMVDFIDPSIKVRQVVLGDLRNDLNFTKVPRVDRCTTCHVNIDRVGYDLDTETGFFQDEVLRNYVNDVYQEEERLGRSKVFASHPNLDLYLGSASPHPIDEAGCTTCHLGRDRGVTFKNAAHTPSDAEEAQRWYELYGWKKMKHWDNPMLASQYVESACAQCHTGVVELPQADRLNRGVHLIRTLGCHGCHKITKPTLANLRKVGPDLRKVSGKLDRNWILKWVRDPMGFRPTTKMPKIFDLPNVNSPEDLSRNTAAVSAITTYLLNKSDHPEYNEPPVRGDVGRGETLVSKVGCKGCHVAGKNDDVGREFGLRNFGPNLNDVGSKLTAGWLYAWLKNPKAYFPETKMPDLRLTDQESADITAYLLTLRNTEFEERQPAEVDRAVRDEMVLDYLKGRLPFKMAKDKLAGMSDFDRDLWLGEKVIGRQGCFGCHLIPGFEDATPIGTELTEEGSKDVDKLDFAMNPTNIPKTRHDWFYTKLKAPRLFDEGKVKVYDEKLRMPQFHLTDEDAQAVTAALLSLNKSHAGVTAKKNLTAEENEIEKGRWLVYDRNCKGCHIVEGEGGTIREPLVSAYGAEGISASDAVGFTPPILNGEGKKVQPDWFFGFLKAPTPIRPWLQVRMPTFGLQDQDAIDLVTYFSRLDRQQFPYQSLEEKTLSSKEMQGAKILYSEEIYNCFTCHQQGDIKPKGDPASWAPDLTLARSRLKPEWVKTWLWDPQKIQPGTKMPTFFGEEMTYLPEDMAQYLKLPKGIKPEDGMLTLPSDVVIEALADYIVYGLHQGRRVSSR
jgi:cbb3-type cytochrome oxidase cytochrome c subunit